MMKKFTQLLTALVFVSLSIFISCNKGGNGGGGGGDPEPELDDTYGTALAGTWTPSSVTFDGSARTEWDDANFTLTLNYNEDTNQGNIVANNPPADEGASDVWGSNVTWTFSGLSDGATEFSIVRADIGNMTAAINDAANPTQLTLTFSVSDPNGRVAGFYGDWEFVLTK